MMSLSEDQKFLAGESPIEKLPSEILYKILVYVNPSPDYEVQDSIPRHLPGMQRNQYSVKATMEAHSNIVRRFERKDNYITMPSSQSAHLTDVASHWSSRDVPQRQHSPPINFDAGHRSNQKAPSLGNFYSKVGLIRFLYFDCSTKNRLSSASRYPDPDPSPSRISHQ